MGIFSQNAGETREDYVRVRALEERVADLEGQGRHDG